MNIQIDNTHFKFIEPKYHFGQKLKTADGWGVVTGMQRTFGDYQQWKYSLVLFLSEEEGFSETAYTYNEDELKPVVDS